MSRQTEGLPTIPPRCLPAHAPDRAPIARLPEGSTDCHCHVFDDASRYPLVQARSYTPAPSPPRDYLAMCEVMGISRTVQVNASVYGFDNRITLDLIAALGQDRARGVAGVAPDVSDAELHALHDGGMRGLRLSTHVQGYGGTQLIHTLGKRVSPLGWHVQVHVAHAQELSELEHSLLASPSPLVFDHLGCVMGKDGVAQAGFQALLRILARRDDCWVKVSSWYRRSARGQFEYDDMLAFVQALVDARPDRVLFGTNWPHPNLFKEEDVPADVDLINTCLRWVPDEGVRRAILVDNPAMLYGFPASDHFSNAVTEEANA